MAEEQVSAGLIPYRRKNSSLRLLLLKYPQGHWGFPKGHVEEDENLWETAVRELDEETGLSSPEKFPQFSYEIEYTFTREGDRIHKYVVFFAGEVDREQVSLSHEHRDYRWVSPDEAFEQITYENEKNTLREWMRRLRED